MAAEQQPTSPIQQHPVISPSPKFSKFKLVPKMGWPMLVAVLIILIQLVIIIFLVVQNQLLLKELLK